MAALKYTPLDPQLDELIQRSFRGRRQILCEGFMVTVGFKEIADDILNMEVREDDVWVCTYPKSGTTWTEELVWCIANDLDFSGAKVSQCLRFPFLEFTQMFRGRNDTPSIDKENLELPLRVLTNSVEFVKEMKSPRFIKTHLPFCLLPLQLQRGIVKPKIIHVHRNPMDLCISYYHHSQLMMGYNGTLEDFAALFIKDSLLCTPFWKHHLGYLEKKTDFNILYLKYEDMKKDLASNVRKTADFLSKPLTDEQVQMLCDHLSFNNMKNNPSSNNEDVVSMTKRFNKVESEGRFLREGTVGQWKSKFSPEWVSRFRKWTEANVQGTELENVVEMTNGVINV
ncbi:luciferin sulfotransferase-like isoform X2 [Macrosteles quadrilineatus]|nr:luciferin sulfotransferase-like isoform X2 [Macrosteles quadrilineatus]